MNYKPTILIADDSETFVMYISIVLNRMSFEVIPVENGLDAFKLTKRLKPDIVMLDINLPIKNGITVLKNIKEDMNTSCIPVIMLSLRSDEKVRAACKGLSCEGFLTKPINIMKLHEILQGNINYPGGKKRKFIRTTYNRKVSIDYKGILIEYDAVSLSEGGMYIRGSKHFPKGTEVSVIFPVKDDEHMNLKGSVIYNKGVYGYIFNTGPGMAIEFKRLSCHNSALLRDYISGLLAGGVAGIESEHGYL